MPSKPVKIKIKKTETFLKIKKKEKLSIKTN